MSLASWQRDEPRAFVEAPLRRTLTILLIHLLALFTLSVLFCAVPTLCQLPAELDLACHLVVPAMLVGYVIVDGARRWRHRIAATVQAIAWARAGDLDRDLTDLIALVGVFAALAVGTTVAFLVMHLAADPGLRHVALSFIFVALGTIYALGVHDWVADWGRRLGRRCDETDARFRAYWAGVGGR